MSGQALSLRGPLPECEASDGPSRRRESPPSRTSASQIQRKNGSSDVEEPPPPSTTAAGPACPLTKKNLRTLEWLTQVAGTAEEEGKQAIPRKRPLPSTSSSEGSSSIQSPRTSLLDGRHYRFDALEASEIYVDVTPPPADIDTVTQNILRQDVPVARREEITRLVDTMCGEFTHLYRQDLCMTTALESAWISPLYSILWTLAGP